MSKVCMLTTGHSPKDDRIFYKEALSLKSAGYEVIIVCTGDEQGLVRDMGGEKVLNPSGERNFEINGVMVSVVRRPCTTIQKALKKFLLGKYLRDFINAGFYAKADVYHAHEPLSLYIALKIQKKTGAKVIFDSHEHWKPGSIAEKWLKKYSLPKLKFLITANEITRGDVLTDNKFIKAVTIYNCARHDIFRPEFNEAKIANPVIVHEGRFVFDRGLKEMMEVLRLLKNDFTNVKLKIVGQAKGKEEKYLLRKIKEYNLQDNVFQTGWQDYEKVGEQLKDTSIGLIMNTFDNYGMLAGPANKFFNYLTYGIAVVAVDLPETMRLLEVTHAGITVSNRSVENIYLAIKKLLSDKKLLRTYCENAFNAGTIFNWKKEEEKLLKFYEQTILY